MLNKVKASFAVEPLYVRIKDDLAERIARGDWKPGATLPAEPDLARAYGISAGTARKALDLLESEHIVERIQGRGTFVTDIAAKKAERMEHCLRKAQDIVLSALAQTTEGDPETLEKRIAEALFEAGYAA